MFKKVTVEERRAHQKAIWERISAQPRTQYVHKKPTEDDWTEKESKYNSRRYMSKEERIASFEAELERLRGWRETAKPDRQKVLDRKIARVKHRLKTEVTPIPRDTIGI